jgi:hypothetical protein
LVPALRTVSPTHGNDCAGTASITTSSPVNGVLIGLTVIDELPGM